MANFPVSVQDSVNAFQSEKTYKGVFVSNNQTLVIDTKGYSSAYIVLDNFGLSPSESITISESSDNLRYTNKKIHSSYNTSYIGIAPISNSSQTIYELNVGNRFLRLLFTCTSVVYPCRYYVLLGSKNINYQFPILDVDSYVGSGSDPITSNTSTFDIYSSVISNSTKIGIKELDITNSGVSGVTCLIKSFNDAIIWSFYIPSQGRYMKDFPNYLLSTQGSTSGQKLRIEFAEASGFSVLVNIKYKIIYF